MAQLVERSGFLLIDKEEGMTSRQVDNAIGRYFHSRHIGHLGTLDPFASGMMLISLNEANKCLPFVDDSKKTYLARLVFFTKTDTGDKNGKVIETRPKTPLEKEEIERVLHSFLGKSLQIPPMTSAIKVDGEALYKKAHRGEEIERKPREIQVFSINLLHIEEEAILFKATVSKGTYMRTLGEDIAAKLGSVGYLSDLRRESIGDIGEERMAPLAKVFENPILLSPRDFISLPKIRVDSKMEALIRNGVKVHLENAFEEKVCLLSELGDLLAVYIKEEGSLYRCLRGLF